MLNGGLRGSGFFGRRVRVSRWDGMQNVEGRVSLHWSTAASLGPVLNWLWSCQFWANQMRYSCGLRVPLIDALA